MKPLFDTIEDIDSSGLKDAQCFEKCIKENASFAEVYQDIVTISYSHGVYKKMINKFKKENKNWDKGLQEQVFQYYVDLPQLYLSHVLDSYVTLRNWLSPNGTIYLHHAKKIYESSERFMKKYGIELTECKKDATDKIARYYHIVAIKHMLHIVNQSCSRLYDINPYPVITNIITARELFCQRIDSVEDVLGIRKNIINFDQDTFYQAIEEYLEGTVFSEFRKEISACRDALNHEDLAMAWVNSKKPLHHLREKLEAEKQRYYRSYFCGWTTRIDLLEVPIIVPKNNVNFNKKTHQNLGRRINTLQNKFPFYFTEFSYFKKYPVAVEDLPESLKKICREKKDYNIMGAIQNNEELASCATRAIDLQLLLLLMPADDTEKYSFFKNVKSGVNAGTSFALREYLNFSEYALKSGINGFSTADAYLQAVELDRTFLISYGQEIAAVFNPDVLVNYDIRKEKIKTILEKMCQAYLKFNPHIYHYYVATSYITRTTLPEMELERIGEEDYIAPQTVNRELGECMFENETIFSPYLQYLIEINFDENNMFVQEMEAFFQGVQEYIQWSKKNYFMVLLQRFLGDSFMEETNKGENGINLVRDKAVILLDMLEMEIYRLTKTGNNKRQYRIRGDVGVMEYDYQLYINKRPASYTVEALNCLDDLMKDYFLGASDPKK